MMNRITDTVKHLIIINVIMFIGTLTIGGGELFYKWFALYFPKNELFQPWQIITHMFMHGDAMHIFFNMFALWMFGTAVESELGWKRFLFLYFSAGLGALLFQLGYSYFNFETLSNVLIETTSLTKQELILIMNDTGLNSDLAKKILGESDYLKMKRSFYTPMVGASGCIMGILAAFGVMNPNAKLMMIFLPIPVKAKYFIPGIILLDVISALTGKSFFSPSNTAYMAHVGGAVVGFLIMWYWKKNSMNKYRWD